MDLCYIFIYFLILKLSYDIIEKTFIKGVLTVKKILLASARPLALTACSMPKQTVNENKPDQSQGQQAKRRESKNQDFCFTTCLTDTIIKLSLIIKDRIRAFDFMATKPTQEDEQSKSPEEIIDIYQEELKLVTFMIQIQQVRWSHT